jgi:hypothetical protein
MSRVFWGNTADFGFWISPRLNSLQGDPHGVIHQGRLRLNMKSKIFNGAHGVNMEP